MPYALPESWKWIRLGTVLPNFQHGISKRNATQGSEKVVLRLADIKGGEISMDDCRSIRLTNEETEKYRLTTNDILITRVNGSVDLVGSFTLVKNQEDLTYYDHFIRLQISQGFILSDYLCKIARSSLFRRQIEEKFVSTAGQKTVNQSHMSSLIISLPPINEQHRIVIKIDQLMTMCDRLEQQIDAAANKQNVLLNAVMAQV